MKVISASESRRCSIRKVILGAGWNIIPSTTANGSGGLFGKGLFEGSQSYLDFLPEARTDFIVAVIGEELGFSGVVFLLTMYLLIIARGLWLAAQAGSTFGRLLAGAFVLTFFVYLFVNVAMVSGLLPVVYAAAPGELWRHLGHYLNGRVWCHHVRAYS